MNDKEYTITINEEQRQLIRRGLSRLVFEQKDEDIVRGWLILSNLIDDLPVKAAKAEAKKTWMLLPEPPK